MEFRVSPQLRVLTNFSAIFKTPWIA